MTEEVRPALCLAGRLLEVLCTMHGHYDSQRLPGCVRVLLADVMA